MAFSFTYYIPGKPMGDEDDYFEMKQAYNHLNPEAKVDAPLTSAPDPKDDFLDQLLEVELTAPDVETRLHAMEFRATGHYFALPPELDEKRQRKISEIVTTEQADLECKAAWDRANRLAYERSQAPPPQPAIE